MNIELFLRSLTAKELNELIGTLLNKEIIELKNALSKWEYTIDKLIEENDCSIRLINALRLYEDTHGIQRIREIKKYLFKQIPRAGRLTLNELEYFARKYGIELDEI